MTKAFLFVVTVPRASYEKRSKNEHKNINSSLSSHEDGTVSFGVESEVALTKSDLNAPAKHHIESNPKHNNVKRDVRTDTELKYLTEKFGLGDGVNKTKENGEKVVRDTVGADGKFLLVSQEYVNGGNEKTGKGKEIEAVSSRLSKKACRSLKDYIAGLKQDPPHEARFTPPRRHKVDSDADADPEEGDDDLPMEKMVEQTLASLGVPNTAWSADALGTHAQLAFGVHGGARCERALLALRACGVGTRTGSSLSVLPCALHYGGHEVGDTGAGAGAGKVGEPQEIKDSAWNTFVRSVRCRLTVAQVAEQVRAGAALTFDFFFLLMVAALTAAIGLVEDSTVFLVASMLISPLMGPIMAGTFGTAIQDRDLQRMGVVHEIIGLLLALVVGFVFGLVICGINENYGVGEWPTYEITSRCEIRSLWIGALVAVPSGAAVAIAVLAGNTTSLVGVAISASLLPPAVNAGLLWAMSLVHLIFLNDDTRFTTVVKTREYSDNPVIELAVNGSISLLLTIVNIVCIFFAGILVYTIKKVAPSDSKDEQYWHGDLKAARDYNKKAQGCSGDAGGEGPPADPACPKATLEQAVAWEAFCISQGDFLSRLKVSSSHMTWSPAATTRRPKAQELYARSIPVNDLPSHFRRDDQNHEMKTNEDHSSTPVQGPAAENIIREHSGTFTRSTAKFIITPVNDPIYQTDLKGDVVV